MAWLKGLCGLFPMKTWHQGELIALMLRSGSQAMELSPPGGLIIEIVLPRMGLEAGGMEDTTEVNL